MATIFSFSDRRAKPVPSEPAPPRDWTNQELSDLYRAVASLRQAGIAVEVDRGLTDEGDPWMVLCRLDGEVFIHFCRLDGTYLLDSPALARPLRGQHFAELVDLFIAQAARAAAPNVVAFRASKVFLHPAALLTILVWSLYVWSSDTTDAQASEWSDGPDGAVLPTHILAAAEQTADNAPIADATLPVTGKATPAHDTATPERMATRLLQAMDHAGAWSAGNNAAAMQLLAVVSTLVLSAAGTTALDSDGDLGSSAALDTLLSAPAEPPSPVLEQPQANAQSAWDNSEAARILLDAARSPGDTGLDVRLSDPHPVILAGIGHAERPLDTATSPAPLHPALFVSTSTLPTTHGSEPIVLPSTATHLQAATPANEIAQLLGNGFSLARYTVNGLDLLASFNPAELHGLQFGAQTGNAGVVDLLFDAPQLAAPDPTLQSGTFGEAARAFIDAFLDQAGDLQIVASANELVLIDLTAFDDTMDRAYAYSWSMEDGGTISALGHVEFFADYALV